MVSRWGVGSRSDAKLMQRKRQWRELFRRRRSVAARGTRKPRETLGLCWAVGAMCVREHGLGGGSILGFCRVGWLHVREESGALVVDWLREAE